MRRPEVQQFFNIPQITEKALNMQRDEQDLSDFEMANAAGGTATRTGTLQTDDGMAVYSNWFRKLKHGSNVSCLLLKLNFIVKF